ncbi:MAG: SH3 domain-containing protein [Planctomycetaceae bacterium]
MRTLAAIALVFTVAAWPHCVWAQPSQFPYEAEVRGDDVNVRSGPSLKNYETGKLNQGDRVTVIRHDPGGWFAIAPPPGSFSWVDASHVQKADARSGVVRVPDDPNGGRGQAFVHVGSALSDDVSMYSPVRLEDGDQVEILGEKTLTLERGPVLMYQIKPPAEEFRWVKGDFIVPLGAAERGPNNSDPFAVPREAEAAGRQSAGICRDAAQH